MSIQSEITRITSARDSSFTAVGAKGVTVPTGSTIDDLPGLINQISTGTSLYLTVVGGTTQPVSPAPRTIWINTSVTIPKWTISHLPPPGEHFQLTTSAPLKNDPSEDSDTILTVGSGSTIISLSMTNEWIYTYVSDGSLAYNGYINMRYLTDIDVTDAVEGTIWIKPTDNGNGNIKIFDNIFINVGCIVQCINGTWVGKDAMLYQDYIWSPIVTWLYNDGMKFVQFKDVLNQNGRFYDESDTNGYMRLTDNGAAAWQSARLHTSTIVNTQAMHTLHVSITPLYNTTNGYFDFGVATTNTSNASLANDSTTLVSSGQFTRTSWTQNVQEEWTCDISGVTQDAYVTIHVGNGSTSTSTPRIRIHKIWMT